MAWMWGGAHDGEGGTAHASHPDLQGPSPQPCPAGSLLVLCPGWSRLALHTMVLFSSEPESLEGRNHVWAL